MNLAGVLSMMRGFSGLGRGYRRGRGYLYRGLLPGWHGAPPGNAYQAILASFGLVGQPQQVVPTADAPNPQPGPASPAPGPDRDAPAPQMTPAVLHPQQFGVDRPDYRGRGGPAAIRYNNPGAQWPGPVARRYGMVEAVALRDGQGNRIAVFPDAVTGAAATFALLATGRNARGQYTYLGRSVADAIRTWCGGNNAGEYVRRIFAESGIRESDRITVESMRDPNFAIALARAMAVVEAGRDYPLNAQQWRAAHAMFMQREYGLQPAQALAL
jgi:hypothetical protein